MIHVDAQVCSGCRVCAHICPHQVFEMIDKKAVLTFEERCVECGACELNCFEGAIQVTKGTGCLFTIIRDDILKLRPSPSTPAHP